MLSIHFKCINIVNVFQELHCIPCCFFITPAFIRLLLQCQCLVQRCMEKAQLYSQSGVTRKYWPWQGEKTAGVGSANYVPVHCLGLPWGWCWVLLKPPLSWISSETPSGLFQCCGLGLVGSQQEQWPRVNLLGMQELHTHHSIFIQQGFRSHISISSSARAFPQIYSMFASLKHSRTSSVKVWHA